MTKFTKKPVTIEAVLYDGSDFKLPYEFAAAVSRYEGKSCFIKTLEGEMECREGDFIIKGVKGEFYPCKPDVFALTYERTTEYDDAINRFAASMKAKMLENSHKDGWLTMTADALLKRLSEEVLELTQAIHYNVEETAVRREAADVGNFAMMIADNYKKD